MTTADLLAALVLLPLATAAIVALIDSARPGRLIAPALTLLATLATVPMAVVVALEVARGREVALVPGGWTAPVGIALAADGLGAALLVTTGAIGSVVVGAAALIALRAPSVAPALTGGRGFWPLWLLLLAGINAVLVAGDLFNTYVALELLTIAAVGLVAIGGGAARRAALRYLMVAVLGSLLLLTAVALFVTATGSLTLAHARTPDGPAGSLGDPVVIAALLALATIGLALKTALVPFHAWLPPAHAGAPALVSPLMSALVIKASLVVLVRLWSQLPTAGPAIAPVLTAMATVVGVLGALAVLAGSLAALRETRLKRVVAYSTVAQVGYFVLLIPLVLDADRGVAATAWRGVLILVLAHAVAKAAMFLAAGALAAPLRTPRRSDGAPAGLDDDLDALRGRAARRPAATFAFAISGVALAGLPPAFAFAGKWQAVSASLAGPRWWGLVLLLGGLLTLAYTVRVLRVLLTPPDDAADAPQSAPDDAVPARDPWAAAAGVLSAAALLLAALSVALLPAGERIGDLLDADLPRIGAGEDAP